MISDFPDDFLDDFLDDYTYSIALLPHITLVTYYSSTHLLSLHPALSFKVLIASLVCFSPNPLRRLSIPLRGTKCDDTFSCMFIYSHYVTIVVISQQYKIIKTTSIIVSNETPYLQDEFV